MTFNSSPGQSGWQSAALSTPIDVITGAEYVVSYTTDNNYFSTSGFFNPANEVSFDGIDDDAFTDPFGLLTAPRARWSVAPATAVTVCSGWARI